MDNLKNIPDTTELISRLMAVNEECSELSRQLEEVKAIRTQVRAELIERINRCGVEAVSAYGKTAKVVTKRTYTIIDPELFAAQDDKYKTMALYSVNSKKLSAFCNELEASYGKVPDDLAKALNVYEYYDLSFTNLK